MQIPTLCSSDELFIEQWKVEKVLTLPMYTETNISSISRAIAIPRIGTFPHIQQAKFTSPSSSSKSNSVLRPTPICLSNHSFIKKKKNDFEPGQLSNYRSMSNLPLISKTLKNTAAQQLSILT